MLLVSAVSVCFDFDMSEKGLGRVKTQSRANRREKYSFGSPLCEREEHTELRCRGIREADSLPFARLGPLPTMERVMEQSRSVDEREV